MGGPYALVQAYAWANMIVGYTKESGLSRAVADTFSGERPCCLCKRIAAAKAVDSESGRQDAPVAPVASKSSEHLFPPAAITIRDPDVAEFSPPGFLCAGCPFSELSSGPPLPPPEC